MVIESINRTIELKLAYSVNAQVFDKQHESNYSESTKYNEFENSIVQECLSKEYELTECYQKSSRYSIKRIAVLSKVADGARIKIRIELELPLRHTPQPYLVRGNGRSFKQYNQALTSILERIRKFDLATPQQFKIN